MPDPTDEAQALADILAAAATLARCQAFAGIDADKVTEATIERQIALARRLKSAHDVLARVVAGRPDQPTHTTTVGMPVLIDGTPSDVGEWCDREYHAAPGAYCSRRVLLLDISAHTDPHTPNQGDTP